MKCKICGKPIKENTEGNDRYCQGHFGIDEAKMRDSEYVNGGIVNVSMERIGKTKEFMRIRKFVSGMVKRYDTKQMFLNLDGKCRHRVVQGSEELMKCMLCGEYNPRYIRKC